MELLFLLMLSGILVTGSHLYFKEVLERRTLYHLASSVETLLQGTYETSQYYGSIFSFNKDIHGNFQIRNPQRLWYQIPINQKHVIQHSVHSSVQNLESIQFYPNGYSSPGRIELHSKQYLCTLKISMRGRVRKECSKK